MRRHRELKITLKPLPLPLIVCVAVGLWLGALAIAFSLWLALRLWPDQVQPVAHVFAPPAASALPGSRLPATQQEEMFERYKEILEQQQAEQAAASVEAGPRHLDSPRCQFWLQQNRTAPTDKSQANVLQFCYRP